MLVRRVPLASSFAFIAFVTSSAGAADQDLARARVLDQQGVRAYREEHYNDAIRFFEEALKLGGPPSEIWNIAKCHVRMDEPDEAVKSIAEYLSQKGLSAADRAEAEQQLREIEHRHSALTVASSPAGAAVYLEGHRWAGVTPATIDIPPGDHEITIELAGYEPLNRAVTAKLGRAVIVDARLTKSDVPPAGGAAGARGQGPGDAGAHGSSSRPHRLALAAEVGVTIPRFGSIGGSAAPVGYFDAAYVAVDDPRVVVKIGAAITLTGDSWSNTSAIANTNPNCGVAVPDSDAATAFSAFVDGGIAWHVLRRWRIGGDLGLGFATYGMSQAGRDVFLPSCRPSPGVKPVAHLDAVVSYSFSRELRLVVAPLVFEAQPAFDGAADAPRDATGLWLRFGAAAGLAFDIL